MSKKCPQCNAPVNAKYMPFCSKRCSDIDLGRWLKGDYVLAGTEEPDEEDIIEAIESGNIKGDLPRQ